MNCTIMTCDLNFTEMCRCCKRTESGGNALLSDHTYPPVNEMLRSIASLNVLENDGLPSLVCISCLNNIQDAFTFIMQVIQINEELSKILATRKQDENTLHSDFVKNENEDMNHLLKVEDLDEPMLNFYQHRSAVSSYENIELLIKLEPDQDAAGNVDEPEAAVKREEISKLADPLYHASDEEKDISMKEYTCTVNDDDLLMVQKSEEMGDCDDMDDLGVDEDYQVDVQEGNSTDSSDDTDEVQADGDYQKSNEDGTSVDSSASFRKLRTKRRKTSSNLEGAPLLAYTNRSMSDSKRHLLTTHSKNVSFACSKCNGSEDVNCSLKVSGSADNNYENIDLVVKAEVVPVPNIKESQKLQPQQEQYKEVPKLACEVCNQVFKTAGNLEIHKEEKYCNKFESSPTEITISEEVIQYNHPEKNNLLMSIDESTLDATNKGDEGDETKVQNADFEDLDDMAVDEDYNYHEDVEDSIVNSSERESSIDAAEDVSVDKEKICPKSRTKGRKPISKIKMFKCRLCAYTNTSSPHVETHLLTHCKEQPFACSKCNSTFAYKYSFDRHSSTCTGKTRKKVRPKMASTQEQLPLQDLQDRLKVKQYYTVIEVDVHNDMKVQAAEGRGDEDVGFKEISPKSQTKREKTTAKATIFRCNLCEFTTTVLCGIKRHLQAHTKEQPFACSKCNQTYSVRYNMLRHWKTCKGDINRYTKRKGRVSEPSEPLTREELNDPLTLKKYYSVIEIDVQTNDDDLKVPELDRRDGVETEIEEFSQTNRRKKTSKQTSKTNLFKCRLCVHSTAYKDNLRRHLCTHFKNMPFACSNCNSTFAQKSSLTRHWRYCNGEINPFARNKDDSKQMISMTLQDLKDPEKIKNYYTTVAKPN